MNANQLNITEWRFQLACYQVERFNGCQVELLQSFRKQHPSIHTVVQRTALKCIPLTRGERVACNNLCGMTPPKVTYKIPPSEKA